MKIKKGSRNDQHRRQSSDDALKEYYAQARASLRRAEEAQRNTLRRVRVDRNSGFADFPEYGRGGAGESSEPQHRQAKTSPLKNSSEEDDDDEEEDTPSESDDFDADQALPPFYVSGNSAPTRNFPRGIYNNIVEAYGVPLKHHSTNGEMNPVESEEKLHLLIAEAHFHGLPIPVFSLTSNAKETFWRDENMDFYADDPPVSVPGPQEEERSRSRRSRRYEPVVIPAFWEILQRIITNVVSFANKELRPIGDEIQRLFNTFEPDLQQSVQEHMSRLQQTGLEAAAHAAQKAREKNIRVCVGDKQFTLDNLFEALNLDVPVLTDNIDGTDNTVNTGNPAPARDSDLWRPRHAPGSRTYHPGCRHNHGHGRGHGKNPTNNHSHSHENDGEPNDEPKRRGDEFSKSDQEKRHRHEARREADEARREARRESHESRRESRRESHEARRESQESRHDLNEGRYRHNSHHNTRLSGPLASYEVPVYAHGPIDGPGHYPGPTLGHHTRPVPPPSRPVMGSATPTGPHFHALSQSPASQSPSQYGPPSGPPPGHVTSHMTSHVTDHVAERSDRPFSFIPPAGTTLADELMPTASPEGHYGPPPDRDVELDAVEMAEATELAEIVTRQEEQTRRSDPSSSSRHASSSRHSHHSDAPSRRSGRSSRSRKTLSDAEKHKIEVSEYYKQYWKQYFASKQGEAGDTPPPPPPPMAPSMAPVSMPEVQHDDNVEKDGQIRLEDSEFESEDEIWVEATREQQK